MTLTNAHGSNRGAAASGPSTSSPRCVWPERQPSSRNPTTSQVGAAALIASTTSSTSYALPPVLMMMSGSGMTRSPRGRGQQVDHVVLFLVRHGVEQRQQDDRVPGGL